MKPIGSLLLFMLLVGFVAVAGTALAQEGALSKQEDHPSLKGKMQPKDLTKTIGSSILTRDERGVDGIREEVMRLLIVSLCPFLMSKTAGW